jgi:hypothetical protein
LLAYGLILAAFSAIELIFIEGLWRPFDIASYYGLADPAARTIEVFLDFGDRTPAVILNTGFSSAGRMLIGGVLCLACALLVMEAGRRLYGNAPGFLAGLLFTLNIAWAQGYMTLGESIALTLALLSVFSLLCTERNYIVSGLCTGAAACFMPLTLVLIPVSLLIMGNRHERGGILAYAAGILLPLLLIWIGVFMAYGNDTPAMAMGSGFTAVGFLVQGEGYRTADAFMAIADIVLSACLITSFLPLALLGFTGQKTGVYEKYFLAAGLLFLASLALGLYMHYWFFAMPFFALLCAKAFRVKLVESEASAASRRGLPDRRP